MTAAEAAVAMVAVTSVVVSVEVLVEEDAQETVGSVGLVSEVMEVVAAVEATTAVPLGYRSTTLRRTSRRRQTCSATTRWRTGMLQALLSRGRRPVRACGSACPLATPLPVTWHQSLSKWGQNCGLDVTC